MRANHGSWISSLVNGYLGLKYSLKFVVERFKKYNIDDFNISRLEVKHAVKDQKNSHMCWP